MMPWIQVCFFYTKPDGKNQKTLGQMMFHFEFFLNEIRAANKFFKKSGRREKLMLDVTKQIASAQRQNFYW